MQSYFSSKLEYAKPPKKSWFSKNLSIVLEHNCVKCYNQFNEDDKAPYILYPCQHIYCKYCV